MELGCGEQRGVQTLGVEEVVELAAALVRWRVSDKEGSVLSEKPQRCCSCWVWGS